MDLRMIQNEVSSESIHELDEELSKRFIALDPSGYFIISVDLSAGELVAEHFSNTVDDLGRAIDPETGELLGCSGGRKRTPIKIYKGPSAKQVGIQLTEGEGPHPISQVDHALYLGRELQRAEACLTSKKVYVQD